MYKYIPLIIYSLSLFALEIEFREVTSKQIFIEKEDAKQNYKLTAKKHIENFSKKDRLKFFINRKLYMLENNYYSEGIFKSKKTKLFYKKSYILFGKVYLFDVNGIIYNSKVTAKEIIYDGYTNYLLKGCEIINAKSIYRRNKFKITIL